MEVWWCGDSNGDGVMVGGSVMMVVSTKVLVWCWWRGYSTEGRGSCSPSRGKKPHQRSGSRRETYIILRFDAQPMRRHMSHPPRHPISTTTCWRTGVTCSSAPVCRARRSCPSSMKPHPGRTTPSVAFRGVRPKLHPAPETASTPVQSIYMPASGTICYSL